MKKKSVILLVLVVMIFTALLILLKVKNNNTIMSVVVVKSDENEIIGVDEDDELIIINSSSQDLSEFKQGQTVNVYYNGIIISTWPGKIITNEVKLKDDSRIQIADRFLRYAYNEVLKVNLDISSSTPKELELRIEDNNSLKYLYNEEYEFELYKDDEKILDNAKFKLETKEDGKMNGIYKFDNPLPLGHYSGKFHGIGEHSYLDIRIGFDIIEEGIMINHNVLIEDISGNFKGE